MVSKAFLVAGNAIFTVKNNKGEHYTFKVTEPKNQNEHKPVFFVFLLTGPNNLEDYTYLGLLDSVSGDVRITNKSAWKPKVETVNNKTTSVDALPVRIARWSVKQIWEQLTLPEGYDILHVGKCGKCGRALTDPASIESGLGPICASRI